MPIEELDIAGLRAKYEKVMHKAEEKQVPVTMKATELTAIGQFFWLMYRMGNFQTIHEQKAAERFYRATFPMIKEAGIPDGAKVSTADIMAAVEKANMGERTIVVSSADLIMSSPILLAHDRDPATTELGKIHPDLLSGANKLDAVVKEEAAYADELIKEECGVGLLEQVMAAAGFKDPSKMLS